MKVLTVYAHPRRASFCHAVLEEFTAGLREAGHESRVIDLHAIRFNPVFGRFDYASYVDEHIPEKSLEQLDLRRTILEEAGGPLRRAVAARLVRGKSPQQLARWIRARRPRDVVAQQRQVAWAEGLAFVAPIHFCHLPAILKGWMDRVFTHGFAFRLTEEGWSGDLAGRVPLLRHRRALIMTSTLFGEQTYDGPVRDAMTRLIADWGLRVPGIKDVEHVFFHGATSAPPDVIARYLEQARELGRTFEREPAEQ